jgi:hypothetical protein
MIIQEREEKKFVNIMFPVNGHMMGVDDFLENKEQLNQRDLEDIDLLNH